MVLWCVVHEDGKPRLPKEGDKEGPSKDGHEIPLTPEEAGRLLEAMRLSEVSREEHRRAEILADVAQALHGTPDVSAVIEALADRLRLLLRTRLVCVLLRRDLSGSLRLRSQNAPTERPAEF